MVSVREGVDYSGPSPSAAALRAAGRDFVVRYARCFTHPKCITATEAAYWREHGIDVAIVDEVGAERALGGSLAGRVDAAAARARIASIGGPSDGGVIYMAVDFQPTSGQMPAVLAFLAGAASVLGKSQTGVYGSYRVVDMAVRAGVVGYFWQTYAWSGGQVHPRANLYQYRNAQTLGGVTVDYTRALTVDFGQWPTGKVDDMPTAQELWEYNIVNPQSKVAMSAERRLVDLQRDVDALSHTLAGVESAVTLIGPALNDISTQLTKVISGDVDESALAAALGPLVGQATAEELAARLAASVG